MRPAVSPPMSTPSYRRWATRMVWAGAKPSLREASCWRVEVVKGGCGRRLAGLASTAETRKVASSRSRLKASASSPLPMSSRWIFLPFAPTSRASNTPPSPVAVVGALDPGGPRLEDAPVWGGERRDDRPVCARDEGLVLALAVGHKPQRDRLHAP